jgi:hypothetical protein
MTASLALYQAREAGAVVSLDGHKLRMKSPNPLPSEVLAMISAYSTEILELLQCQAANGQAVGLGGPRKTDLRSHARAHTCESEPNLLGPARPSTPGLFAAGYVTLAADDPGDDGDGFAGLGEHEQPLPEPDEYGDEAEHDAWLSGTPIAEVSS